ncbi:hypothetical protein Agub_g4715, partial [Astrephomene gubernaculifera]
MSGILSSQEGTALLNVPAAPTFWPTEDEWKSPLRYLESIRPIAEPYGICKIVPPNSWKPPCALDLSGLKFPTRIQKVHELQHRDFQPSHLDFYEDYDRFLQSHGKQLCKWKYPQFLGKDIDIFVLYRAVKRRGGYELVTEQKRWKEVAKSLQIPEKGQTSVAYGMRQLYVRHLLPYEDWKNGTGAAAAAMAAVKAEAEAAGQLSQPGLEEEPEGGEQQQQPKPAGKPEPPSPLALPAVLSEASTAADAQSPQQPSQPSQQQHHAEAQGRTKRRRETAGLDQDPQAQPGDSPDPNDARKLPRPDVGGGNTAGPSDGPPEAAAAAAAPTTTTTNGGGSGTSPTPPAYSRPQRQRQRPRRGDDSPEPRPAAASAAAAAAAHKQRDQHLLAAAAKRAAERGGAADERERGRQREQELHREQEELLRRYGQNPEHPLYQAQSRRLKKQLKSREEAAMAEAAEILEMMMGRQ